MTIRIPLIVFRPQIAYHELYAAISCGRIERSTPRILSGAAAQDGKAKMLAVTFEDVAGAEQAKQLQKVYTKIYYYK